MLCWAPIRHWPCHSFAVLFSQLSSSLSFIPLLLLLTCALPPPHCAQIISFILLLLVIPHCQSFFSLFSLVFGLTSAHFMSLLLLSNSFWLFYVILLLSSDLNYVEFVLKKKVKLATAVHTLLHISDLSFINAPLCAQIGSFIHHLASWGCKKKQHFNLWAANMQTTAG